MVTTWVSRQNFAQRASSTQVSIHPRVSVRPRGQSDVSKPLHYLPWNGTFSFIYKRRLLRFRAKSKEHAHFIEEEIVISCIGRSPGILRELLDECRVEYLKLLQRKTPIFEPSQARWKMTGARDIRPLSTVVMDERQKTALVRDIEEFLDPRTRKWYNCRGIPYRRGFLFHGPPGTGKSSLCFAVAGCFKLPIYILSLEELDDSALGRLFSDLPERCVVLLEDVDATKSAQPRGATERGGGGEEAGTPAAKVSLPKLPNAIDGVSSGENRLLVMTTNHIERLDRALIRPGRVDRKIEFRLAGRDMVAQTFSLVFSRTEEEEEEEGQEDRAKENRRIEQLARDFAAKIPEGEFSPAELLSHLMEHKHSPSAAAGRVDEWIERTVGDRSGRTTTQRRG